MFEKNILTFNPGWDSNARPLETFTDVRELLRQLKAADVHLHEEEDENTTGPAYFLVIDPDGNPILVDQHVWTRVQQAGTEKAANVQALTGHHRPLPRTSSYGRGVLNRAISCSNTGGVPAVPGP